MSNPDPIIIQPKNPTNATVIFLHGFGDDAQGWTGLIDQFHSASKLPHLKWILPNAPHSQDAMGQAWYQPKPFSPIPMPKRTGDESEDEYEEDDEKGIMASVEYICTLIDREIDEAQVPLDRIVVGGFSQGCAISLLVGLISRYRGRLGGVVGLSGYLPLGKKVERMVSERAKVGDSSTKWFLAHGTRDQLVPMRVFRAYREKLEGWEAGNVEAKVYEGMSHSTTGAEVRDLCYWLEKVLLEKAA